MFEITPLPFFRSGLLVLLMLGAAWGQDASEPRKKVIAWGGIDWYSPEKVQINIREIEKLPFDGTVLQGFKANKNGTEVQFDSECFGKERFEREHLAETIATLKNIDFRRFTDNFLRYNVTPGNVDWFDDFGPILHNAGMWASVTKEVHMKGWMFDIEDYKGTVFNYQKMKYREEKGFEDYARQVRFRGRQFMEAVQAANPDIVILLCLAHSYVNRMPQAHKQLAAIEYGLAPAFINGMIEAAGPRVRIIDGHEQGYGYLTSEAFFRGYHATRQRALTLVPPELRDEYRAKMEVGMAVFANYSLGVTDYPGHWPPHYLTPAQRLNVFEQNVYSGLRVVDEYLWLYSEHIGWWEKGWNYPTPDGAIDAIRSARDKVRAGKPLGFRVSADAIATAEATLKIANPYPSRDSTVPAILDGQAPTVDGLLDDPVWKDVPPLLPFTLLKSQTRDSPPITHARAAFDDKHLYFAFLCTEPDGAGSDGSRLDIVGENKDDDIASGDCIEVSLRAGEHQLPFHFIVNPHNTQWDGRGDFSNWNGQWHSGTSIGAKEWTVEVAIPWSTITRPVAGRSLRAFLCRRHSATNELTAVVQELSGVGTAE